MAVSSDIAEVWLWGRKIGVVAWDAERKLGSYEHAADFLDSGIQPAPLMMPLSRSVYTFPELNPVTFQGLPGMLSDSLPDKFGNMLIDQWLVSQGRSTDDFSPVERLCYIGERGMGALEFRPLLAASSPESVPLEVQHLVKLANEALAGKERLRARMGDQDDSSAKAEALKEIIQVGTSAGGARAKAVIAWHPETGEVRSGQARELAGFEPWLIKFDGVTGNRDKELADSLGYGTVEYVYHLMAQAAGISMSDCRLLRENGRAHFMTRRFDRTVDGKKIHLQSLCAMGHYDFNLAGATSYEQCIQTMRRLDMSREEIEQQFRRAIFNVVARNQDDHTKNIAFLMDKSGAWTLSPAYDVTFAYNPSGEWTGSHQMSLNGKREAILLEDLLAFAEYCSIRKRRAKTIIEEVEQAVGRWAEFAAAEGVGERQVESISASFCWFLN